MRRQFKMDRGDPGNDLESNLLSNKDTVMNSLWKLNVVDIEITVIHVCQMVSFFISAQENLVYALSFILTVIQEPFLFSYTCLYEETMEAMTTQ